jgi:general stress protein 26
LSAWIFSANEDPDMQDEDDRAPEAEAREKLFAMIKDMPVAMLTTVDEDGSLRARPMGSCQPEGFDGTLWFFTRAASHKVLELQETDVVNVAYASPGKQTYISLSGRARLVRDWRRAHALWSPSYKMWIPDGLEDPDLVLLRVDIEQAEYWDVPSSTMRHLLGLAKSALTGTAPSHGDHKKVKLAAE